MVHDGVSFASFRNFIQAEYQIEKENYSGWGGQYLGQKNTGSHG